MSDKYQNKYRILSARWQDWDYTADGYYFITICTKNKIHFFGEIIEKQMILSSIGKIAKQYWLEIPTHFPFIKLDSFVIMPNHVHGIVIIDHKNIVETLHVVETLHATSLQWERQKHSKNEFMSGISPKYHSISTVIRSYKSAVTKSAKFIDPIFAWQTRFYDHIIRDHHEYRRIAYYIETNIEKWTDDDLFEL